GQILVKEIAGRIPVEGRRPKSVRAPRNFVRNTRLRGTQPNQPIATIFPGTDDGIAARQKSPCRFDISARDFRAVRADDDDSLKPTREIFLESSLQSLTQVAFSLRTELEAVWSSRGPEALTSLFAIEPIAKLRFSVI